MTYEQVRAVKEPLWRKLVEDATLRAGYAMEMLGTVKAAKSDEEAVQELERFMGVFFTV